MRLEVGGFGLFLFVSGYVTVAFGIPFVARGANLL
jgi:hypothetical protein